MKRNLNPFEIHQRRIAVATLRMSDAGASIMGGMSKSEAKEFLAKIGYTTAQMTLLENQGKVCGGNPR